MQKESQSGACAGVRVLDLSTMVSGPLCGQILGDFGADVIKLEAPGGDTLRRMQPIHKGMAAIFTQFNRNKRSVVVDIRSNSGRDVARRLAEQSDVLIENFRPGVAERLGLGYADLKRANSGLVYVSINGFGSDGPYAKQPAYDHVIQGLVGFMSLQGSVNAPQPVRTAVADKISSVSAALAVLAALFARANNGGLGQLVNVRMLDSFAAFMLPERMSRHTFQGAEVGLSPVVDTYQILPNA